MRMLRLERWLGVVFDLSFTAKEEYRLLKWAMKYVWLLYIIPFQRLLQAVEQFGEEILRDGKL